MVNRESDAVISELRKGLYGHADNLEGIPGLLKRIIKEGMWKRRIVKATKQEVGFDRFQDFVTTPPLEGLGTTLPLLRDACRSDLEALDLLDQETVGGPGGNNNPYGQEGKPGDGINTDNIMVDSHSGEPEHGTSRTYALRRLRTHRPDLHADVLAGAITPHAAMIEAGFRQKTATIQLDPAKAAQALYRKFSQEEIGVFLDVLQDLLKQEGDTHERG